MQNEKLFLLDSYALIYRAYYAFINNPRINSKGLNTSAMLGFINTLEDILKNEKPKHIAAIFDPPGPTFRHDMFPEYKANRDETPEDIRKSVPYIKQILEGYGIPVVEVAGYEADDVAGTLAKQAAKKGYDVFLMTPDKDYYQLVEDHITVYKPARGGKPAEKWGVPEVCEKFGITDPLQVIDILGLWGDSADNVPGAPGIGEKTSKQLVGTYGSIEGVYEHINDFKGKRKENLINFKEQIMLSKVLVTIELEVDVTVDWDEFKLTEKNTNKLEALFNDLEFKALSARVLNKALPEKRNPAQPTLFDALLPPEEASISSEPDFITAETVDHSYHLVNTPEAVDSLIDKLHNSSEFCFDTETTGLSYLTAEIVGLAISVKENEAYYVPFTGDKETTTTTLQKFQPVFESNSITKIAQNIKYDMGILANYGIVVSGVLFDTMIAHYLLHPDKKHNLDTLSENYLSYRPISIETLIGAKGKNQKNMRDVALDKVTEYACEDADLTFQLKEIFSKQLTENNLLKLFQTIEMPLVPVLLEMETNGIRLDSAALNDFAETLRTGILKVEAQIYADAGVEFNIGSPKQLGEVLFETMKVVPNPKKTKTKQYATSEQELQKIKDKHPVIARVLSYRSLRKLLNTYVDVLPGLVNEKTGRIHTSYNQAVAATGRLSSANPNLQNIPIRTELGKEIRKAFVPASSDNILLAVDYSQIELRLMAQLSKDKNMLDAFINKEDIHTATAAKIFGVETDEVTGEMRSKAKSANFGIIYGISSFGLARNMNIPIAEAKELINGYFKTYPQVREYMDEVKNTASEKGYVETIFGRKRYLADINSRNAVVRGVAERNAINAPIQGSAADLIKMAMIVVFNKLKEQNCKTKMILQVHDELVFDVPKDEKDKVLELVVDSMEKVVDMDVEFCADYGFGDNWLQAH